MGHGAAAPTAVAVAVAVTVTVAAVAARVACKLSIKLAAIPLRRAECIKFCPKVCQPYREAPLSPNCPTARRSGRDKNNIGTKKVDLGKPK